MRAAIEALEAQKKVSLNGNPAYSSHNSQNILEEMDKKMAGFAELEQKTKDMEVERENMKGEVAVSCV